MRLFKFIFRQLRMNFVFIKLWWHKKYINFLQMHNTQFNGKP